MWSAKIALPRFAFPVLLLLLVSGGSALVSVSALSEPPPILEPVNAIAIPASALRTPDLQPVQATPELDAPSPQVTPTPVEPVIESIAPPTIQPTTTDPAPAPDRQIDAAVSPAIPRWSVVSPAPASPSRIVIPSIGVDTRVVPVATTESGAMEAPEIYSDVGWYRLGAAPGDVGRAVLAGHVDSRSGPAVFYRLRDLKPGDVIEVSAEVDGHPLRFVVRESARYPEDGAPLDQIFGPSDRPELVLITCDGAFDRSRGSYDHRLVVYADLLPPDTISHN
jgi:sortase (surface protein transpeptidase)